MKLGLLARVVILFSARGYNIDSFTVAQVETGENLSRITITDSPLIELLIKLKLNLKG